MRRTINFLEIFITGSVCYSLIEIVYRGSTHWTMMLLSGTLFTLLYLIEGNLPEEPLWKKCLIGAVLITAFEFTTGIIFNIILGWGVWDYSRMPFNILGQVCLPFSLCWFFLCIPAYLLCHLMGRHQEKRAQHT